MKHHSRDIILVLFLVASLVLGGASREGHLGNFALQLGGIGLLGWGFYQLEWSRLATLERLLIALGALGIAIVLVQFVPLSPDIWRHLPGRAAIANELDLLNVRPEPALVSLSLHDSLRSAVSLLPAFGLGIAMLGARRLPAAALLAALAAVALSSLAIGIMQVLGGTQSPWYFYSFTNRGFMVGFFANANHMATLLLVSLLFIAALVREGRTRMPKRKAEITLLGLAMLALAAIGIGLVGSLTGYALLGPVILASALIIWKPRLRLAVVLGAPVLALAAVLLAVSGDGENVFSSEARTSVAGREEIRTTAWPAAQAFFPVGSGLGTFEEVYRRYENPKAVTSTFVAHAHNDYLELVLELGVAGIVLIGLFLAWWLSCLRSLLRTQASAFAWAGWGAVGVMLVHSGWDYPLRTAALSTAFALSCVLAARAQPQSGEEAGSGYAFKSPR